MNNLQLLQGDITTARVDAIVNAANASLLGGGGVDGALHRAAGPALLAACRALPVVDGVRCPVGEARITLAGNLQADFVIHAVGPRYHVDTRPAELLASAYRSSLDLALAHDCARLALPAISCGVFGYPLNEAAQVAFAACGSEAYHALDITFYLFGEPIYSIWSEILETLS